MTSRFVQLHHHPQQEKRKQDGADKISLHIWKTDYLYVTKTIEKQLIHISLISLVLLLAISLQLVASYNRCFPLISACVHFIITHYTFAVLEKLCQENFRKFQEFCESKFGSSEKDRYFLKILKWQHKLVRDYKRGKLDSYFQKNAAKAYLHQLKISEKTEVEHVFQSKAFFHLSRDLRTSCFNTFK